MKKRIITLPAAPRITACATIGGRRELDGPLGNRFDITDCTDRFGKKTWEEAESEMQRLSLEAVLKKAGRSAPELDCMFAGDLLNQCVGSVFGLVDFPVPFFGIFGACSTVAEGLLLASLALCAPQLHLCSVTTSSHNCSAERQFRTPVEYGGQRTPTAQWTVTGAASYLLTDDSASECFAMITALLPGMLIDSGISDANNMGAAMAPAAADTFLRFFAETGEKPSDYDLLVTGDLGAEGSSLFLELLGNNGLSGVENHTDCGLLVYDRKKADVHSGGSGCGCAGTVLGNAILPRLSSGELGRVLFAATGALMNTASVEQGNSIPGVCHLLRLVSPKSGAQRRV